MRLEPRHSPNILLRDRQRLHRTQLGVRGHDVGVTHWRFTFVALAIRVDIVAVRGWQPAAGMHMHGA